MNRDLNGRLFSFSIKTIKYLRTLSDSAENRVIKYQLIKSATSVGANYEEVQGASSKQDFTNKVNISLKEIRESNYWLRLIKELNKESKELNSLISESEELKLILGKIVSTARKNRTN